MHAQSTYSSPGIMIHVARSCEKNRNRHHNPSRLSKARFITHQSVHSTIPEISIPISIRLPALLHAKPCCHFKQSTRYDHSISIQRRIRAFIQPDHQNRNWNKYRRHQNCIQPCKQNRIVIPSKMLMAGFIETVQSNHSTFTKACICLFGILGMYGPTRLGK